MSPRCTIAQFAKAPELGRVKTRLQVVLDRQTCLDLHCWLTEDILQRLHVAGYQYELWVAGISEHPFFKRLQQQYDVSLMQQVGSDLGERLFYAGQTIIERGEMAILIGSDCPFLTTEYVKNAQDVLREDGCDAVVGPALDGGYVLLGLARTHKQLFSYIPWGTGDVLQETERQLKKLSWRYKLLPALSDIDRPEDLALLRNLPGFPSDLIM